MQKETGRDGRIEKSDLWHGDCKASLAGQYMSSGAVLPENSYTAAAHDRMPGDVQKALYRPGQLKKGCRSGAVGAGSLKFVFILFFSRFSDPGVPAASMLIFRPVTWILPIMTGGPLLMKETYHTYKQNDND